jgi:hypothetical protein
MGISNEDIFQQRADVLIGIMMVGLFGMKLFQGVLSLAMLSSVLNSERTIHDKI